jgi:hypothetical protein
VKTIVRRKWLRWVSGALSLLALGVTVLALAACREATAGPFSGWGWGHGRIAPPGCCEYGPPTDDIGGMWYWLRSPDEEKRVVSALYNRYCIRCHGVDGRGVWDIPGIPDFTNPRWQACRSDAQRARIILEGRGAVMPPFRGAITVEEAWAIGRYLRTLVPGTETSRPDLSDSKGSGSAEAGKAPAGKGEPAADKTVPEILKLPKPIK